MSVPTSGPSAADEARNRSMGAGLVDDPYPVLARVRDDGTGVRPGTVSEHFGLDVGIDVPADPAAGVFTAFGYGACRDVLADAESFSSHWYDASLTAAIGPTMIAMDAPEHRRMRFLLQATFSRREMQAWIPRYVRPVVDEHLARVAPWGACDLYREVGATVPVHTISAALGLPVADRELFFDWAVRMTSTALTAEERQTAARELGDYVRPLVAERRARDDDGEDLLSVLVHARMDEAITVDVDDRPLSDDEIATLVRLLVIAGAGTTYRAYGNLMYALLTHPEQLAEVRADRALMVGAIEESLRLEQPIAHWGRITRSDREVAGVTIPAGCPVNISVGAANHDPARFPDPDRFDIHRADAARHLSFGHGVHRCLGIHLARAELTTLLDRTLDVLPDLELDRDAGAHMTGLAFRMPTALPVRYTPTTA